MLVVAAVAAILAGLLHCAFFVLESVLWSRPTVWPRFGVRSQADAEVIRPMALNQGWYNLFLAAGALIGAALLLTDRLPAVRVLTGFACGCMLGAAVVLLVSNTKLARAAVTQGLFPLIAVIGVLV